MKQRFIIFCKMFCNTTLIFLTAIIISISIIGSLGTFPVIFWIVTGKNFLHIMVDLLEKYSIRVD